MGVIVFEASDTMPERSWGVTAQIYRIHVTNWRVLCEHEKKDTIFVIASSFKAFEIENMTAQEFLDINTDKEIISKPFQYDSHTLSCDKCHGVGKVDWVKNVINVMPRQGTSLKAVRRNGKDITKFLPPLLYDGVKSMIGSVPILHDGDELCSSCRGTGIYYNEGK